MSDMEQRMLGKMVTAEGMATAVEKGLQPDVFVDPLHDNVCRFALKYWENYGTHPTEEVFQTEFRGLKIDTDAEESAGWLVDALQKRFVTNELQDLITSSAVTSVEDPKGTLRTLWDKAGEAVKSGGVLHGSPRIWNALDLESAQQPRWLAKNRLPRAATTLLIGEEGLGKSLFWALLIAHITNGTAFEGFGIPAREPGVVVLVLTEDDWSTDVLPRLKVTGADLDMIRVFCTDKDGSGSPVFPRDIPLIDAMDDPKPVLVVVDCWLDTVPKGKKVSDPQQAREVLHPWKELATRTDAAVMLLGHTNRIASATAREKYGGTYALRQKCRMTLFGRTQTTSQDALKAGLTDDLHEASHNLNALCRGDHITRLRRGVFGPATPERNQS